jgi:Cof subfamily protein (haloacid dehalogenase superfamily)
MPRIAYARSSRLGGTTATAAALLLSWLLLYDDAATTTAFSSSSRPLALSSRQRRFGGLWVGSKPHNNDAHNSDSHSSHNSHHAAPFPSNSTDASSSKPKAKPNKADLYSPEDLADLWNLHQSLTQTNNETNGGGFPEPPLPPVENDGPLPSGLHDMVLQALEDMDAEAAKAAKETKDTGHNSRVAADPNPEAAPLVGSPPSSYDYEWVLEDEVTRKTLLGIRAIATDVDGTLTSTGRSDAPQQQQQQTPTVHPLTHTALARAVAAAASPVRSLSHVMLATGKTRPGALRSLGPVLNDLLCHAPGVFCQGLYCVDGDGNVIFEQKLTTSQADAVIQFAHDKGLSIFCYDGDTIMTTRQAADLKHIREVSQVWGEPEPILLESLLGYEACFHKCIVWSDDTEMIAQTIRPKLQALAEAQGGSVTQAIPTMLEFLPAGASKALGVQKLCEHLGIQAETELLAIGDAENDLGFLQMAAYGVAVGNAAPKVKEIADLVMEETSDEGGAGLAIDLFGLGNIFKSNHD